MSFKDWYYPQPVTDADEAEDDVNKVDDSSASPTDGSNAANTDPDGSQDWLNTGVAKTFGQDADIDISGLSIVSPSDIQYTNFNDYLSARGLPERENFFSSTDFSSLQSYGGGPGAKTMSTIAATLTGDAMLGFAAGALGPQQLVQDPTGRSTRGIPESGFFNVVASMKIAEEFKDLGEIKAAYEKNPNAGKVNGFIMHDKTGRPIYRMPGSRYYKHNIRGLGQISELQGKNLENIAMAKGNFQKILSANEGGGDINDVTIDGDTFISTPGGGYNLNGTFNYGAETSSRYGNMKDMVSVGNQAFGFVTDQDAKRQATARTTYAQQMIEGLRAMPFTASSKERMAFVNNFISTTRGNWNRTSVNLTRSNIPTSKSVAAVKAMQVQGPKGGESYAVDYEGDYALGEERGGGAAKGEMSRDEAANEYNDNDDFNPDTDWDGDIMAQGGRIRGYAPGGGVTSAADDALEAALSNDVGDYAVDDTKTDLADTSFGGDNDDDDRSGRDNEIKRANRNIRKNIVSAIQDRSLTPDERYEANQMTINEPTFSEIGKEKSGQGFVEATAPAAPDTSTFGSFVKDAANSALQAGFLQAVGMAIGFNYGGTVKNRYNEGAMIRGEQATQEGDPILTANEVMEGSESGFIQSKPSQVSEAATVADDVDMRGDVGGEIINASAVIEAGEADIAKMIEDAREYARRNGIELPETKEKSDIRVSKGEAYIEKELVPIIGKDKIRKINNRGKKDTRRKIKQTQMVAEGGFIKKKFANGDTIRESLSRAIGLDKVNITQQDAVGFMTSSAPPEQLRDAPTPSTPLPKLNDFETQARSLLEVLEDNRKNAYVPKGRSKSGATIGIGFDIGQHSVRDLQKMGLDSATIEQLTPYTMKKGQSARNFLKANPLSLSERQVEDINSIVLRDKYEKFQRIYPEYSEIRDVGKRAVMFSAFFGGGLNRYKTFRNEFDKAQNIEEALKKGLINIVPKGAAEHNRAKKALNWYRDYGIKVMPIPRSRPRQNLSATR